ncbi:rod-binding protein [Aliiroseovarius sp. 2305UL8-7]|uniref:rod-binding protein n=1 Tax=Aliiroseovarius conchicola TaxID=3121637 RepID=UPI0035296562
MDPVTTTSPTTNRVSTTHTGSQDARLMAVAQKLEASFLSEMLKSAGLGQARDAFGGGAGEDQFSSFLRQAQAEEMVKTGGIGLAQSLFEALKEAENEAR